MFSQLSVPHAVMETAIHGNMCRAGLAVSASARFGRARMRC